MAKNYYVILGVSEDEDLAGIRAKYRDLARQHHPDATGRPRTDAFRAITEAYQVLSDPDRRRAHNRTLRGEKSSPVPIHRSVGSQSLDVEPLAAEGTAPPISGAEPLIPELTSVFCNPERIVPSLSGLVDRFRRNFTGVGVPKSEHLEPLNLELVLSTEDALCGGVLSLGVPVFVPCTLCGGSGRDFLFPCMRCGEHGVVEQEQV